ncbi:hypothetical protein NC651_000306 [Populus alba x Populus x berolinensis]|nr:hypothetical protein NC651_000306 [Populus alba x Populus x berolinensis]
MVKVSCEYSVIPEFDPIRANPYIHSEGSFRNQKRATRVLNFSRFQICKYFHEAGVLGLEATLDNQRVAFVQFLIKETFHP